MDEEDRLSALPDDIIHRILSLLPMDVAVRTSILSNRWLHQWKFVNVIHFPSLRELERGMGYGFVDQCLYLLRAPKITKFVIVAHVGLHVEPNFAKWISFAVARHVRTLEFYMEVGVKNESWNWDGRPEHFNLPDSFYLDDTESREEIALSCVNFCPKPKLGFRGFRLLRRLFLYDSRLSDKGLQSVVSTCNILQSLSIIKCSGLCYPRLSSVSLKELVYSMVTDFHHSTSYCGPIKFEIDAPNLVTFNAFCNDSEINGFSESCYPLEVRLLSPGESRGLAEDYVTSFDEHVLRLMSQLSLVQFFGFNSPLLHVLIKALQYNGGPCNAFRSLKEFYFSWGDGGLDKAGMVILLKFLGDCPSLSKIQLEFGDLWVDYPRGILPVLTSIGEITYQYDDKDLHLFFCDKLKEWGDEEEAQLSNANTLNQLTTIELYFYFGTKAKYTSRMAAIDFLKRLLLKAVCLETLTLFYEHPKHHILQTRTTITPLHLKQQLLAEVSLLPRASPCAEIRLG